MSDIRLRKYTCCDQYRCAPGIIVLIERQLEDACTDSPFSVTNGRGEYWAVKFCPWCGKQFPTVKEFLGCQKD